MHIFVNGKELANALNEFKRAGIKTASIRATSNHSIELFGGIPDVSEDHKTCVRLWIQVPLSRDIEPANFGQAEVRLKDLSGMKTEEVEIEVDCFGLFVNHVPHDKGLIDYREHALAVEGWSWDDAPALEIAPEDCKAIAWTALAIGASEELEKRGFDRLCLRDGIVEATDGARAHRAALTNKGPEMCPPGLMVGIMSRMPGTLRWGMRDGLEAAEYRAGSIRIETARKKGNGWPDFSRIIPVRYPAAQIHAPHVLKHVTAAVKGYKDAEVSLEASQGKRDLVIVGIECVRPMKEPLDTLRKENERRKEIATMEDPAPVTIFAGFKAQFLKDALAAFPAYAQMHYENDELPLLFEDGARFAVIMPLMYE